MVFLFDDRDARAPRPSYPHFSARPADISIAERSWIYWSWLERGTGGVRRQRGCLSSFVKINLDGLVGRCNNGDDRGRESVRWVGRGVAFSSQASPGVLAAMREIARGEGRQFQVVMEEAMEEYFANRRQESPRTEVMVHFRASVERNRRLMELLAE